ncbi:30S ribosomal protein 3, chloroplastic [Melia azedarach]|uniref:30S ribosomal protein 3, chloroplastic n=1 Tax=Melia azedarach TaxID=155640 RepID=A0ACC1X735_MELAZ|nr:30S ribosomal protein 3, chloroplastic [Melia azedarach]
MSSMSFLYNTNAVLVLKPVTTTKLSSRNLPLKPSIKTSVVLRPQPSCLKVHCTRQVRVKLSSSSAAADPILDREPPADDSDYDIAPAKEKLGVVVKPNEKPRLVLKFIWMQNDIGIALDQMIPGHGTIPLSPYYFWPRKDAWEELKVLLESKPWISQMERVHLLNQATDVINLWQASGGNL